MSSFFRFLSKRGPKSSVSSSSKTDNQLDKHVKLNVCEDLKESIEHYNQRCLEIKKLKEKNVNNLSQPQQQSQPTQQSSQPFFSFKSFKNKNPINNNSKLISQFNQNQKDLIECAIVLLDDTQESFFLHKKSLGSKLYEQVFYHLDLIETDYFGLQFSDTHNVKHWLDPSKPIRKQCKIGPPYQFFFKVKFYTAEPNNLKEELTRYFYFLQLKHDLRTGQLNCSTSQESICVELCALILQEELGDYDENSHAIETISEFRFLPEYQQTEEFEEKIFQKFSTSSSYKGMTPAEAELTFLNKAKWLEMYGVDMHSVYGRDQNEYKLGLTPSGILVFEENQPTDTRTSPNLSQYPLIYNKIGLFYWPKIEKVSFSKKKFTILVAEDDNNGLKQEHTFIFNLIDEKACKHLWKCAVEYHAFFRLRTSPKQLMMLNSNGSGGLFNGFIRRGSRFRGPERTEFQTHNLSKLTTPRRSVQFERRPSQRFSRRASYAIKRKLQEQQKQKNALVPSLSDSKISPESDNNNSISNCCKLQMTSNGAEHDQKCNLYKEKLMISHQKEKSLSSTVSPSSASSTCSEATSSSSEKLSDCEEKNLNMENRNSDKLNKKEIIIDNGKNDVSVMSSGSSSSSSAATVPMSDIRLARPRSSQVQNNVKIVHLNAVNNNVKAQAFTLNSLKREMNRIQTNTNQHQAISTEI
ncbi:unnamed protein product [Brachionus calyciflorus]|uniref:FERM domain-containing protein n=1 Tax=Brachionus calyciflorus TaxID=104777 RepID=A0A813NNH0_9BILA|nr:unnamed protein product [Brachionus calyciflorus]